MHQTSTGTKKTKKNKISRNYSEVDPLLGSCWKFQFFFVFLVPVQVWCIQWFGFFGFFDACAMFCEVRLHQTLHRHQKTKKTKVTSCRKPRQAKKKTKKKIKSRNYSEVDPLLGSCWKLISFFGFFGACAGLVHLVVCFFCFFWCLCRFGDSDFTKH